MVLCFSSVWPVAIKHLWIIKVYLPAIEGYVPQDMVRTVCAFLKFVYLAQRNVLDTWNLEAMAEALERFQHYQEVFVETGIRKEKSTPPRQHSLVHYIKAIRSFGAPNRLCTSITESKHKSAVKKPWQRSSHFNAIGQMLLTNQCLDKLAASRVDFTRHGMLKGTCLSQVLFDLGKGYSSIACWCDAHNLLQPGSSNQ